MSELLNSIRRYELESVRNWFAPGAIVVEIGGGSGFQAAIIAAWGCNVRAFDLAGRPASAVSYHPVDDYDGVHLPLPDASVDLVFSSNVLEHVRDLSALLADTQRVMKPGAIAVHILPTPAWRFWSIIAHYPFLAFTALGVRTGFVDWTGKKARRARIRERGVGHLIKRISWPGPHGEFPGALAELVGFRSVHWIRALETAGFAIENVSAPRLWYSGYGLFPKLPVSARNRLASVLGSSTQTIVARKPLTSGSETS